MENLSAIWAWRGNSSRNLEAGDVRADGPPEAANFRRRLGLQIVKIEVTRSAIEPDQNHRLFARAALPCHAGGREGFGPKDVSQSQAGHPGHTQLDEAATAQAIAITRRIPPASMRRDIRRFLRSGRFCGQASQQRAVRRWAGVRFMQGAAGSKDVRHLHNSTLIYTDIQPGDSLSSARSISVVGRIVPTR